MIENATLKSLTTPPTPNARGGSSAGTTTTYAAGTRCCVDQPKTAQLVALANKIAGIEGVLFVYMSRTATPLVGSRIVYRLDGMTADTTVEVLHRVDRAHVDQSHYEVFFKSV
jgi:hypothetical protein